jgi:tetratricopeptide (TPR) repeat protein
VADKTTVKVFIASAKEVAEERETSRLVLGQLNKSYPHLHFDPVLWETDMVKSNYPDHESVQAAIDEKLKECELVVFIFYSRIGDYTKLEFELAQRSNKKIMAFFKEGFSPRTAQIDSFKELSLFRDNLTMVLKVYYDDLAKFEFELYRNLNLLFSEKHLPSSNLPDPEVVSILSQSNQRLIQMLAEKDEQIRTLEKKTDKNENAEIRRLKKETAEIRKQLLKSEEIISQQSKDREALEVQLASQKDKDVLKRKALEALEQKNYREAENYLKESAQTSIDETASTFYELAKIKNLQFEFNDAFNYYELALKVNPEDSLYLNDAGLMAMNMGFFDKAIAYLEKSLALDLEKEDKNDPETATRYCNLGSVYADKGEYQKAIAFYEKALAIDLEFYGEENSEIGIDYNNLSTVYIQIGEYDTSVDLAKKSLAIALEFYGLNHRNTATSYNSLGLALYHKDEFDEAIINFENALASLPEGDHPDKATWYSNMALAYQGKGEYGKAIELTETALAINKKYYKESHPEIALRYSNLGSFYHDKGDYDTAVVYIEKSLAISHVFYGDKHPEISSDYNILALIYQDRGDYENAIKFYNKAIEALGDFVSSTHPQLLVFKENLATAIAEQKSALE